MPSKGMGSRTQAEAKLNAAFKKAGFNRSNDRAYSVPAIEKAMKVYYKDLGIGALKKPASMTKGSLVAKKRQLETLGKNTSVPMSKLGVAKKAAPKKAAAAKKPGMSKSGPRRASY
jgi:hypothetical protein